MTRREHALALAAAGFFVFPLLPGRKTPPKDMHFKDAATRDPAQIATWWAERDWNIGIYTGKYGDGEALLVVDVDNKGEKRGSDSIIALDLQGMEMPPTFETATPTGGKHIFYRVGSAVRQGANVLGAGVDVRSRGGYVVGAGSAVAAGHYACLGSVPIAPAPSWLVALCGTSRSRGTESRADEINVPAAQARATHYLEHEAPKGESGARNDTGYKVAARCKDLGVDKDTCLALMAEHWQCEPALDHDELAHVVNSAYTYGNDAPGSAAPEAEFDAVPNAANSAAENDHPFSKLNREFAFVIAGGGSHILWETTDAKARAKLEHLATAAFHAKFAASKITIGKRTEPLTQAWMEWKGRRGYDGIVFIPGREAPQRFYNLWRGFAVEPATSNSEIGGKALDAWLEHLDLNVCHGDAELARWLIGFLAHLVQRPWEKPLVALVFKGAKGVGKNALVNTVGALLGRHYLVTSKRRYLVGNFNGHLENLLMFTLDEATWAGDKQAEGELKDLITGDTHVIEQKGKEPYEVDNCTRIVIIGNEDWLVPASHDERRFAVFDVGEGRKQDRAFFQSMRAGMERGGYGVLLRYLLDYNLQGLDFSGAPQTTGLMEQKVASLDAFPAWWLTCLSEGKLVGGDFETTWPAEVDKERFRAAFRRYAKERNVRGWMPDERGVGRMLAKMVPSVKVGKLAAGPTYRLPMLDQARVEWGKYIGHQVTWE